MDYGGISPLTLPAEALLRAIKALSHLFWITIAGTVLAIFLAALANLGGSADGALAFGEYSIPVSVLPIGCLAFAMFMLWLTAARFRMLEAALGDDDLTASLARDIFRLDPPVLDVFDAGNLRPFALLSGCSVLLWIWSLFFGSSVGLIFSATIDRGALTSTDEGPIFGVYAVATLVVMAYGATKIVRPLRRILARLHGEPFTVGPIRLVMAMAVLVAGVLVTNPDLFTAFTTEEWRTVGPSRANAVDGETLVLEGGEIVSLGGIAALRPGQTCGDAEGRRYPCGDQATAYLQSLVQDRWVHCFVSYPRPRRLHAPAGRRGSARATAGRPPARESPGADGRRRVRLSGGRRHRVHGRATGRSAARPRRCVAGLLRPRRPLGGAAGPGLSRRPSGSVDTPRGGHGPLRLRFCGERPRGNP